MNKQYQGENIIFTTEHQNESSGYKMLYNFMSFVDFIKSDIY